MTVARIHLTSWLGSASLGQIDVVSGSWKVTDEAGVDVPGSIEFSVPATDKWIPVAPNHPLQGLGQRVWARVDQGDGFRTWGWYRLDRPTLAGSVVQCRGRGLLRDVQRYRLTQALQTTPAVTRSSVLRQILAGVLPVSIGLADKAAATATYSEDRLAAFWDIVESWPARAYMSEQSVVIVPAWDDANPGAPTVSLVDGVGETLVDVSPAADTDDPRNGYWVSNVPAGEEAAMVRSWVMPDGPMAWDGPYGRNPGFYSSPLLPADAATLVDVAQKMTRREVAVGSTVTFTAVPSVVCAVGDVAVIRSKRRGVNGTGRITSLQLTSSALTGTAAMLS